jgi:hypothetical protein
MGTLSREAALNLFEKYLGEPDNFETEWNIFNRFLDNESAPYNEDDVVSYLLELIDGLLPEDETPRHRLNKAIEAAKALLNK